MARKYTKRKNRSRRVQTHRRVNRRRKNNNLKTKRRKNNNLKTKRSRRRIKRFGGGPMANLRRKVRGRGVQRIQPAALESGVVKPPLQIVEGIVVPNASAAGVPVGIIEGDVAGAGPPTMDEFDASVIDSIATERERGSANVVAGTAVDANSDIELKVDAWLKKFANDNHVSWEPTITHRLAAVFRRDGTPETEWLKELAEEGGGVLRWVRLKLGIVRTDEEVVDTWIRHLARAGGVPDENIDNFVEVLLPTVTDYQRVGLPEADWGKQIRGLHSLVRERARKAAAGETATAGG